MADRSSAFARDLETCIREHAAEAARTFPTWGCACLPPTEKIDMHAAIYERTLSKIYAKYGYVGALWCAFYSVRMTGKEFNPNSDQPNNPNIFDWYQSLLCPYNLDHCEGALDSATCNCVGGGECATCRARLLIAVEFSAIYALARGAHRHIRKFRMEPHRL